MDFRVAMAQPQQHMTTHNLYNRLRERSRLEVGDEKLAGTFACSDARRACNPADMPVRSGAPRGVLRWSGAYSFNIGGALDRGRPRYQALILGIQRL